jgi:integrase
VNTHITKNAVEELEPPASGYYIAFDDKLAGFGVRVTAAGVKSFVYDYRVGGRKRRYTIGRFGKAQWSVAAARGKVEEIGPDIRSKGADPAGEKKARLAAPTMKELCDEYIEQWAIPHKRASSIKQDRRMINTRVLPAIGKMKVSAVGRREVEKLHNSLRKYPTKIEIASGVKFRTGVYEANRVKSLLSKMLSLAVEWEMRTDNPCKGIPRFPEPKHEFWLSVDEFQRLELALNEYEPPWAADAIRLLALTGCREGEGLNATWPQFDLQRGTWTKPSHATKEKKTEIIPLGKNALALLSRMAKQRDPKVEWLFPADGGERAHTTLRNAWRMVCRKAGLATRHDKQGNTLKRWKPTIRINDLRHSFASHLVSRGASLYEVGKLMGHTQASTTARYAHVADAALRAVANEFTVFGNVVEMPTKATA